MPRIYKRKTDRGRTPRDILVRAAQAVKDGSSIRSVASDFGVDRMTLKRFIDKYSQNPQAVTGYENCKLQNSVFTPELEKELAEHIKNMAKQFHGLTKEKSLSLIFEFAYQNNLKIPDTWREKKKAGQCFWISFKERQHLSIRAPEATSLARATAFNRFTVGKFFDNLADVMDRHNFQPHEIYNLDETGCTTVQSPGNIVSEQGIKQVGSVTSAERGELVTVVYTISASGVVLPPMFIFPRVNFRDHFLKGAPNGSIGSATKSGWMNEELFLQFLRHVIHNTRCSIDQKILLILDNHESHVSLAAVDLARQNGIILLTIPPHTSHKLQPLDKTCYGPFKLAYSRALDGWMRSNVGKTVTIYDIPGLVNEAQMSSLVPRNIISGFRSTGIYPYNRDIFSETDYAPASVTDRELPEADDTTGQNNNIGLTEVARPISTAKSVECATASEQQKQTPRPTNDQPSCKEGSNTGSEAGPTNNIVGEGNEDAGQLRSTSKSSSSDYPGSSNDPSSPQPSLGVKHVSPSDILPLPKAAPRKRKTTSRKKGSTKILTDTPVRNDIAAVHDSRQQKKKNTNSEKAKQTLFRKKQTPSESSSSESDLEMELMDDSDSDSSHESHVNEIMEGDFVIVKIPAKSRVLNYIARVDVIDVDEVEGIFLRRVGGGLTRGHRPSDQHTFVLNPKDEASFPRDDIIKKLPNPVHVGSTSRCQMKFPCNLDKWDLQ